MSVELCPFTFTMSTQPSLMTQRRHSRDPESRAKPRVSVLTASQALEVLLSMRPDLRAASVASGPDSAMQKRCKSDAKALQKRWKSAGQSLPAVLSAAPRDTSTSTQRRPARTIWIVSSGIADTEKAGTAEQLRKAQSSPDPAHP
eukprot:2341376-Rhodomonas_salina.1